MKHYRDLESGMVNFMVLPSIEIALTGVKWAKQRKDGQITLEYTDGTLESRPCKLDINQDFASAMGVIDYVQAGR